MKTDLGLHWGTDLQVYVVPKSKRAREFLAKKFKMPETADAVHFKNLTAIELLEAIPKDFYFADVKARPKNICSVTVSGL